MRHRFAPFLLALVAACSEDGSGTGGGVALLGDSVTVEAGESARFCIELSTGGQAVAATQNDLRWEPGCLTLVDRCTIEPATGKQLMYNQRGPGDLRLIVISLEDVDPIPDGELYCCPLRPLISGGCCPVDIVGQNGSDPQGRFLTLGAADGEICVE